MNKRKKDLILATGIMLLIHAAFFACISIVLSVYTNQTTEFVRKVFERLFPTLTTNAISASTLVTLILIACSIFTISSLIFAPIFIQKSNLSAKEYESNKKSFIVLSIFTVLLSGSIIVDVLIIISLCLNPYKDGVNKEKETRILDKRIDKTSKQLLKLKMLLDDKQITDEQYNNLVQEMLNNLKSKEIKSQENKSESHPSQEKK